MKKNQNILIGLTLILFTACKNDCRVVKETYDNKKEKIVFTYPDCNDTTYYKRAFIHENGQLSSEGYYKNGQQVGIFMRWTEKGILIEKWGMLEGKEHGLIQCWYPSGMKKREAFFDKGVKNGIWKDWDENGKPTAEGTYRHGKKDGKWTFWENNGSWSIRTYKNDTLWGYTYEYIVGSSEFIQVIGQYERGLEEGLWKWLDKDSLMVQTAIFTDGKYTGEFIKYHTDGSIKSKGNLVNGKYEGKVTYYDKKGNITKPS